MKISITCIFISISLISLGQSAYEREITEWQKELNESFKDPEESPLEKKQLKKFSSLDFFPVDKTYRAKARFVRSIGALPFTMKTTQNRVQVYEKYAEAHFELHDQKIVLPIYQNHRLRELEEYKDYLFLPFTDLTNGLETYGGGRYLDLKIPEGDSIIIDFNKAYNPYCAYSSRYSCPIPPRENDLPVEVRAGVKAWDE